MKSNVAAAKAKVEEIARGIDIGEKGTLGDLLFGPDQVTKENLFLLYTCQVVTIKSYTPVIEKYKLPPIQIFDKNCPLKRVNQKFAIFRQNVRKLELIW